MKKLKKFVKWGVIVGVSYFILTTLYFGYDDIDSKKGIYKFYWSGLRGLWVERPFGFKIDKPVDTKLNGVDGPYLFGDSIYFVDESNEFRQGKIEDNSEIKVMTTCKELKAFTVKIKDSIKIEKEIYELPQRLIAISDIEGNFNGFYSFLLANKIIDKNANWIFGDGHLVLNGDFFDRGTQVTQVLWLIYHLENQAEVNGGKVHYILGNHEVMNLYGDVSYNDFKYIDVAKKVSKQNDWDKGLSYLYSEKSELGNWLRSKNIIEKIGDVIFVHGGLNADHLQGKYTIQELNTIAKNYYGIYPTEEALRSERDRPIISSINSPFWDRRLNFDWKYKIFFKIKGIDADATTQKELDDILFFYGASKIVIGHSVVEDIEMGYNSKVVKIDVKHGQVLNSGKTKGILLEKSIFYKLNDLGEQIKISE